MQSDVTLSNSSFEGSEGTQFCSDVQYAYALMLGLHVRRIGEVLHCTCSSDHT